MRNLADGIYLFAAVHAWWGWMGPGLLLTVPWVALRLLPARFSAAEVLQARETWGRFVIGQGGTAAALAAVGLGIAAIALFQTFISRTAAGRAYWLGSDLSAEGGILTLQILGLLMGVSVFLALASFHRREHRQERGACGNAHFAGLDREWGPGPGTIAELLVHAPRHGDSGWRFHAPRLAREQESPWQRRLHRWDPSCLGLASLSWTRAAEHILVIGKSGCGKTKSLYNQLLLTLRIPWVFQDVKGGLPCRDRHPDAPVFGLDIRHHATRSGVWNPCQEIDTRQHADLLAALLLPDAGRADDWVRPLARSVLTAILRIRRWGSLQAVAEFILEKGIEGVIPSLDKWTQDQLYRIQFPKGMDANEYSLKVQPAAKSLGLAIRSAVWMGKGQAPERSMAEMTVEPAFPGADRIPEGGGAAKEETTPERADALQNPTAPEAVSPLAAAPQAAPEAVEPPILDDAPLPASPVPPPPGDAVPVETQGRDLLMTLEDRAYRIRGWEKPLNPETLKVNLMVTRGEHFFVDTLDLYQAKARTAFIRQAGLELSEAEDRLKRDLGQVLRKVEAVQADALSEALAEKDKRPPLTETEHAEALALLKAPDLMARILRDFAALGIVGEEPNKLTGYLSAVSRLLDRPLALLIQSASAAGKSSLMDAVLDLVPEEDVIRYSAMSGQSLFYMGDRALQHKILAIAEEEGAKQATYALKLLQSEGRVTMASTGKDPATGMLTTHDYTVEGPVMLFLTTTAIDLDEELLNRCLVLTVNESREQTRAIHALQRQRETLEGLLAKAERERLLKLHRNAQRLLRPLAVVNPYADQLSFRDDQTRSRRDHVKYLTLIRSIALLHQFQRDVKTHGSLRYIEVIPEDIAQANELAQEVLGRTVDELLPQTRKLLTMLHAWVQGECKRLAVAQGDFTFTRRQVREAVGWGDSQLKIHLDRLAELEFLLAHRGRQGQTYAYELLYQGEDAEGRARLLGLIDCASLQPVVMTATSRGSDSTSRGREATSRGEDADFSGPSRGVLGPFSGPLRGVSEATGPADGEALSPVPPTNGTKPQYPSLDDAPVLSYPQVEP